MAKAFVRSVSNRKLDLSLQNASRFSPDLEVRQNGNIIEVVAFSSTAENAETKANAAIEQLVHTIDQKYGPDAKVTVVEVGTKSRKTTIFDRYPLLDGANRR